MMKLRNRSYVKYSTYALIAAFMVSMTPAGAMADISAGVHLSDGRRRNNRHYYSHRNIRRFGGY